jgi:hypothetical protein
MEEYRSVMAAAAAFAAGARDELRTSLETRMRQAAGELQFEKAGTFKARLDRLEQFQTVSYRHVAPLEQFRFIFVEPSASMKKLDVFLVNGPTVCKAQPLDYPPAEAPLGQLLQTMAALASAPVGQVDQAGLWRMGLVAHYLFSGPSKAGVIVRYLPQTTAGEIQAAIESAAEVLHARKPKAPKTP